MVEVLVTQKELEEVKRRADGLFGFEFYRARGLNPDKPLKVTFDPHGHYLLEGEALPCFEPVED